MGLRKMPLPNWILLCCLAYDSVTNTVFEGPNVKSDTDFLVKFGVRTQTISPQVCTDTAIVFTAAIPNSGAHRPTWAKYGEYIYCPPQQWVHNLQVSPWKA
ncbi:unnamed protein product [Ranitomeya imitator]|uniref:Uncharacterized protein n=1 Tax=Ranitomeya imitator TaxID=111125 RepID=A0ABN9L6S8_9NEOB|nr:unnamed protein product [Ranitomeya imitator]